MKYNLLPFVVYIVCIILDIIINIKQPNDYTATYAVWWFIPAIVGSILTSSITIALISDWYKGVDAPKGTKIGILGAQGSGKTTLLHHLQNKKLGAEYDPNSSVKTKYEEFYYLKTNGEKVLIASGIDLPGREQAWQHDIKDYIESFDILFYLFDASKFLNDAAYRKEVVSPQLAYIAEMWKTKNDNNVVVIASHADKIDLEPNIAITKIQEFTVNKKYKHLLASNFGLIDAREKKQIDKIFKTVIK